MTVKACLLSLPKNVASISSRKDKKVQGDLTTFLLRLYMTLLSPLMSTERHFSENFLSRNSVIALEPSSLSKFCKEYSISHILGNRKLNHTKLLAFTALDKIYFEIIYRFLNNFITQSANVKISIKLYNY